MLIIISINNKLCFPACILFQSVEFLLPPLSLPLPPCFIAWKLCLKKPILQLYYWKSVNKMRFPSLWAWLISFNLLPKGGICGGRGSEQHGAALEEENLAALESSWNACSSGRASWRLTPFTWPCPQMRQNVFQYPGSGLVPQGEASFSPMLSPGGSMVQMPVTPPAKLSAPTNPAHFWVPVTRHEGLAARSNGNQQCQVVPSQPAPAQPAVYNNMSFTVSMAGANANVQNMNLMMVQMQMSSLQMPGMNAVCSEQMNDPALRHTGLYCNQLSSTDILTTDADGNQDKRTEEFFCGDYGLEELYRCSRFRCLLTSSVQWIW